MLMHVLSVKRVIRLAFGTQMICHSLPASMHKQRIMLRLLLLFALQLVVLLFFHHWQLSLAELLLKNVSKL